MAVIRYLKRRTGIAVLLLFVGISVLLLFRYSASLSQESSPSNVAKPSLEQPLSQQPAGHPGLASDKQQQPQHVSNKPVITDYAKQQHVREMLNHAWSGYARHAWGSDELNPVSVSSHNWTGSKSMLFTPIDAMDTLFIAGLRPQYEQAKQLVLASLDFNSIHSHVNVFETNIRVLGGLLSAYDLDPDQRLLDKAVDLADRLLVAFHPGSPFVDNNAVLASKTSSQGYSKLATSGTMQLEFQYLSDITGDPKYSNAALDVYEVLHAMQKRFKGLYPLDMVDDTHSSGSTRYSIAAEGDSFYEYLLKIGLSTRELKYREWYDEAALAIETHLLVRSEKNNIAYLPDRIGDGHQDTFHHLSCFAGGMFSLGASTKMDDKSTRHLKIGADLTETCYTSYQTSKSKLGGENVRVTSTGELVISNPSYLLRPELVESIFYMWRITHEQKYRDWGWNIVQALDKECKTEAGYAGLGQNSDRNDRQESFFLAETLKYLYLLFSDDDVIPLEKYVFNTEAHPLSIRGHGRRWDPKKWVAVPSPTVAFQKN